MNLNPYEPDEGKSGSVVGSRWRWPFLFLLASAGAILLIYYILNLGNYSGLGRPRRYASYRVEFETPFSIWQWSVLTTIALGLSAIAIAIMLLMLRRFFERRNRK